MLEAAGLPIREIKGASGCAAVTLAAGRIVAFAFSEAEPNLLWTHPDIEHPDIVANRPETLAGGIGGERLWFSPELDFHWKGKPDWTTFANYAPPAETDPGIYRFESPEADAIALTASPLLPTTTGAPAVQLSVSRRVALACLPTELDESLMAGVLFAGLVGRHTLELGASVRTGKAALWHLWQAPVDSVAIVPLRKGWTNAPLAYGHPGDWSIEADHIAWRFGGDANAKLGVSVGAAAGRLGLVQRLTAGRWALIVREHPVDRERAYCDHPYGTPRTDQVVQMWDGFGFGEVEYHSPAVDGKDGPRKIEDHDIIWAFGGPPAKIAAIGRVLLGVGIERYLSDGIGHG